MSQKKPKYSPPLPFHFQPGYLCKSPSPVQSGLTFVPSSLIALSLIMALLQFKPAPMYILDEVDAALDLSHTQNIGRLIKTRFKGSQFIVVSLKDGMFQNANRIFKTRFSEGTCGVQAVTPGVVFFGGFLFWLFVLFFCFFFFCMYVQRGALDESRGGVSF